ncbi:uncharacterized protein LOC113192736 isoform X2 [Urocitellus parryii]
MHPGSRPRRGLAALTRRAGAAPARRLAASAAGSSGWRKSPALAPCSHCGPCLCLLFWNVLRVLIPVTVTCKSKRHIPLEEKRTASSGLKKKTGVLPV